jgi:hypothetical protein
VLADSFTPSGRPGEREPTIQSTGLHSLPFYDVFLRAENAIRGTLVVSRSAKRDKAPDSRESRRNTVTHKVMMIELDGTEPWRATVQCEELMRFVRRHGEIYQRVAEYVLDDVEFPVFLHRPGMRGEVNATCGSAVPGWV